MNRDKDPRSIREKGEVTHKRMMIKPMVVYSILTMKSGVTVPLKY